MGLASFVCPDCHRRLTGRPTRTATGRRVCETCAVSITAAGVAAANGEGLAGVISTMGWLRRVRAARGKDTWPGEDR